MVNETALANNHVTPQKLLDLNYQFRLEDLEDSLRFSTGRF